MTREANPIFGRKVFFVNPPLSMKSSVIDVLKEQEYEVYVIDNFRYAKPVLKQNPSAVAFFCIDDQMSFNQWYNYLKSYEFDDNLKSCYIGVISGKLKFSDKERLNQNVRLPGGIISLNNRMDVVFVEVMDVLNATKAKGKRQYLRLDASGIKEVSGYLANGKKLYVFDIINISSVGLACICNPEMVRIFIKNSVIENVSLSIGHKTFVTSVVVYDARIVNNKCVAVLLLARQTPLYVRVGIKGFIYDVLETHFKMFLASSVKDSEDYSVARLPKAKVKAEEPVQEQFKLLDEKNFYEDLGIIKRFFGS